MSEEKKCKFCIHRKMCDPRNVYDDYAKRWNNFYPFVKMNTDGDLLASVCKEYKTLSEIHFVKNKQSDDENETPQDYEPSRILKRILIAIDQLDEMSLNPENYTEEEFEELWKNTKDLAKKLTKEEFDYAQNYISHTKGLGK